jgi:uncharacterized protein
MNIKFALAKLKYSQAVLIILIFSTIAAFSQTDAPFSINESPLPAPTSPVNDYVGVFDPAAKQQLETRLKDFKTKSGVELAVGVVKSTGERPIFDYSLAVARGWKIGSKADDNPSALLFVAIDDRKYYTQVSKDLEDELPDGIVGNLQRQFLVPEFKKGNYSKGITDTIDAYIRTIESKGSGGTAPPAANTNKDRGSTGTSGGLYTIFCCLVVLGIIALIIWSNRGGGGKSGRDNDRWGGGGFGGGGSALPWVIGSILASGSGSSSSSSSSSWGGSSGGSDWGGFGGGGDFGGGGAGGDW